MKVDLREKLKEDNMLRDLPANHRTVFEKKLNKELHARNRIPKRFLSIAASIMIIFSLGYFVSKQQNTSVRTTPEVSQVNLEEYSPELKKIENYYLTAINFELVSLEVTDENKAILDDYLRRLNTLTKEYELLSKQLRMDKIDEGLINSLIDNLQMRLQLMVELKNELKKIKSENNEELTV